MARLSGAATLLAGRRGGEPLPRTRRLAAYSESDGPASLAGTLHGRRGGTPTVAVRRDSAADFDAARRARRKRRVQRAHPLPARVARGERRAAIRIVGGPAADGQLSGARFDAGNDVARGQ